MREQEAALIHEMLTALPLGKGHCVLELGSSDRKFRETSQPHIARNIHTPLAARGVKVVTTDIKEGEGIDIAGDIYDPTIQKRLLAEKPDVVLCCNILEHLTDRASFARACDALVRKGGHILLTVPYSYPYHLDPIDTLFRPTPEEIAQLFPGYRIVSGQIVDAGNFSGDMRRAGSSLPRQFARTVVRSFWPWEGIESIKDRWHKWFWYARPYRISVVLLQK